MTSLGPRKDKKLLKPSARSGLAEEKPDECVSRWFLQVVDFTRMYRIQLGLWIIPP
jgi:hypothetical protein